TALIAAWRDLYRALGVTDGSFVLQGTLERAAPAVGPDQLLEDALEHRPDLFARQAALVEAEARMRLQQRDRFGNPSVGPAYELNETKVNFIGVQVGVPSPLFNRKRGESLQLQAQRA